MKFYDLPIPGRGNGRLLDPTLTYLRKKGFLKPSPVQQVAIPAFSDHKDVVVEACTGSGKTLSYLIPTVERLFRTLEEVATGEASLDVPKGEYRGAALGAVILAPTRELVEQIEGVLNEFLSIGYQDIFAEKRMCIYSLVLVSGRAVGNDRSIFETRVKEALTGSSESALGILIATPGRMRVHLDSGTTLRRNVDWCFSTVEVLVMDEADRLFSSLKMKEQLQGCLAVLPRQRRTGLFSATLTDNVQILASAGLRNPTVIKLSLENEQEEQVSVPLSLSNYYAMVDSGESPSYLLQILASATAHKTIVFFPTCACVEYFHLVFSELFAGFWPGLLSKKRFQFHKVHGQMDKPKRRKTIKAFSKSSTNQKVSSILFASDLAARGLDFDDVGLIIQYVAPNDPAACVHRMGRTGRAGRAGTTILFLRPAEQTFLDFLAKRGVPISPLSSNEQLVSAFDNAAKKIPMSPSPSWALFDRKDITFAQLKATAPKLRSSSKNVSMTDYYVESKRAMTVLNLMKLAAVSDRQYIEAAKVAFVSHVRFYKEHTLQFVFVFADLDLGVLANSYGLCKIPRVKEVLGVDTSASFVEETGVESDLIKFVDEAKRLKFEKHLQLAEAKKERKSQAAKEVRDMRKKIAAKTSTRCQKRKYRREIEEDEWFELQREERLHKKKKKSKNQSSGHELDDEDIDALK